MTHSATVGQVWLAAFEPTTNPEMPCADEEFVYVGLGGSALDPAHRGRLPDVVDFADDREHRAIDVGQRDEVAVNGKTAGHHPVMCDELLEQFGDSRAGPRDPALRRQEPPLLFPRQQRLAVVQLAQEVHPRLRRFLIGSSIWKPVRASQPGMSMREKTWSAMKSAAAGSQPGGQVHRQPGQGVQR